MQLLSLLLTELKPYNPYKLHVEVFMLNPKDAFLTPIYLIIFIGLAQIVRRHVTDEHTKKYFMPALLLKFLGAAMVGIIYDFYYEGGDSFSYYTLAKYMNDAFYDSPYVFFKILLSNGNYDPETWAVTARLFWYNAPAEFLIVKFASVLGLLCFHTYTVIAFFFAIFSFSGLWAMYTCLNRIYPGLYKEFAIALFFVPSIFFWGSGLMKDSICLGALGWMFFASYRLFIARKSIFSSILILIIMIYIIQVVKVYIVMCFLPALLIWVFMEYNRKIKSSLVKILFRPLMVGLGLVVAYFAVTLISAGNERYNLDKIAETNKTTADYIHRMSVMGGGAAYSIGELDGTFQGMIKLAPQAVFVTLFRPFLWEVRNPIMLLSALESLWFLLFTLSVFYKTGIKKTLSTIFSEPLLLISLIFAIILSFAVGVSTFNFGTLVRYKIPMMPFYLLAMFKLRQLSEENAVRKLPRGLRIAGIPARNRTASVE